MSEFDYYKELHVRRDATVEEIRSAFRRLAMKHHPDRNPGNASAERKFRRLAEAYDVLSDPAKRTEYDRGGVETVRSSPGFRRFNSTDDIFRSFADVLDGIFGEHEFEPAPARRGEDYEAELSVSSAEATTGGRRSFTLEEETACGRCGGSGIASRSECPTCSGEGIHAGPRAIDLTIPRGIQDGTILRLRGMGGPSSEGGHPGDLLLRIRIDDSPNADHVAAVTVPVDMVTATLGGTIRVPMNGRSLDLAIPAGVQSGQSFRVERSDGHGEILVTLQIEIPRRVTRRQRKLLEEFRRERSAT